MMHSNLLSLIFDEERLSCLVIRRHNGCTPDMLLCLDLYVCLCFTWQSVPIQKHTIG